MQQENSSGQQTVAQRLRHFRKMQGLTLTEVAEAIGYNKGYLSRLESGASSNPSPRFLDAVCRVFGLSRSWLESGAGENRDPNIIATFKLSRDNADRIESYENTVDWLCIDDVLAVILDPLTDAEVFGIMDGIAGIPGMLGGAKMLWFRAIANHGRMRRRGNWMEDYDKASGSYNLGPHGRPDFTRSPAPTVFAENQLTSQADSLTSGGVKSELPKLIARLRTATSERGSKSLLAAALGVHRQCVTDWLSGKQTPNGETTLRLLTWVTAEEAKQQESPAGGDTPAELETRKDTPNEKSTKPSPPGT